MDNSHFSPIHRGVDLEQARSQISAADVVIAVDSQQETHAVMYGRGLLEEIARSGNTQNAAMVKIELDSSSNELDELDALVREVKGSSSFQPCDFFPEFEVDVASFALEQDLLPSIQRAVKELCARHRTLLPPVLKRFYYSVRAAGFETAMKEFRMATCIADEPVAYIDSISALGHLLYKMLPADEIKPNRCIDIVHGIGSRRNKLGVKCRSLSQKAIPKGPVYHSPRMPMMRFRSDPKPRLVVFSEHALERICERTVYDWKTFGGHGDAFAFMENCIFFEDCTDVRGEPSFVVYNSCIPHHQSWNYVERVLETPPSLGSDAHSNILDAVNKHRLYYRVGYCPVKFNGDMAVATTLLFPGMSRQRGTPEGKLIERSGLLPADVARMKTQVETQLSMKALSDSNDFTLVKWFHDNGLAQVIKIESDVFKYD